jgi:hypothetical protein
MSAADAFAPAVAAFRSSFRLCVSATRKRFLNFAFIRYFLPIRRRNSLKSLKFLFLFPMMTTFDRTPSRFITRL